MRVPSAVYCDFDPFFVRMTGFWEERRGEGERVGSFLTGSWQESVNPQ